MLYERERRFMLTFLTQQVNEWKNLDKVYLTFVPDAEKGDTIHELIEMGDYIWAERYSCLDNQQVGIIIDMLKIRKQSLLVRGYYSQVNLVGSIVDKFEQLAFQRAERN